MNEKKLKHKIALLNIYISQMNDEDESDFMKMVLRHAIRKLSSGADPKKVESWVVKLEKTWRKKV